MKRILLVGITLVALLAAAHAPAAPKKVNGGTDSKADWLPVKDKNGGTIEKMTPRECSLVGGEITKVTPGNCPSGQACFVKIQGGATGAACIS